MLLHLLLLHLLLPLLLPPVHVPTNPHLLPPHERKLHPPRVQQVSKLLTPLIRPNIPAHSRRQISVLERRPKLSTPVREHVSVRRVERLNFGSHHPVVYVPVSLLPCDVPTREYCNLLDEVVKSGNSPSGSVELFGPESYGLWDV